MISLSMDIEGIFSYLLRAGGATLRELFGLMGPGLLLVSLMSFLATRVTRLAYQSIGRGLYLGLFGWLGTTVHELGHLLFALLFGHKIREFRPYKPDPATNSLGYVITGYSYNNLYQVIGGFFIGIGPILFGTTIIFLSSLLLLEPNIVEIIRSNGIDADTADLSAGFMANVNAILRYSFSVVGFLFRPEHFTDWRFYLFAYIAFAVGSSIRLSPPDINAAFQSFIVLVIFLFCVNLATIWSEDFSITAAAFMSQFYIFFNAIMIFSLVLNLIAAAILFPFAAMRGSAQKSRH
jgi:hypothetical protein